MGQVSSGNFKPDTVILHPEAETKVLLDYVPGSYDTSIHQTGKFATILGLRAFSCNVADNSSTYVWDYDTNDEIGMLVLDSKNAGAITMRRDIQVERYADPIRDLVGMSVTCRFDANYLQAAATCRVLY
jgi:hypothetical protein